MAKLNSGSSSIAPFEMAISVAPSNWFKEGPASSSKRRTDLGLILRQPCIWLHAASGKIPIVEWLLAEGVANILDVDTRGRTALMSAIDVGTAQWLLEHGGANITDRDPDGRTLWDKIWPLLVSFADREDDGADLLACSALLRVMVLQRAPPADLNALPVRLSPQHSRVVKEGAQLLARLPVYLARRRALVAEHTSLITPLLALVSSYEELTTTEELWATGLGALPGDAAPSWASRMRTRIRTQPQAEARQQGWRNCCCCFWRPWS
jgi:hypothetical protein